MRDGPAEVASYVRHGWGPARGFEAEPGSTGTLIGRETSVDAPRGTGAATSAARRDAGDRQAEGDQRRGRRETVLKAAEDLRRRSSPAMSRWSSPATRA